MPGGRISVDSLRDWARTAAVASWTLGPEWLRLISIAERGDLERHHVELRRAALALGRRLRIEFDVAGLEHIQAAEPHIVAPLHESFGDAVALAHLPLRLRYVALSELSEWPRLGRMLAAGDHIALDQGSSGMRRLVRKARHTLDSGSSLVVFPQGTILGIETAFLPGASRLAASLGAPLLPVVITGTHLVWEYPFSRRLRYRQAVSIRVLPPIPPDEIARRWRQTERTMKRIALAPDTAPARRFRPRRDGFWPGYRYEVDPDFPELAEEVAAYRGQLAQSRTSGL